ncbi:sensor histidine kinase [Candidatus Nanosynbacter lyticus]|uniref:sensor histidine kinase n=1 Tax=Candidatus Nanosynbacter lyticus TaxID=2093824 RepID=UPI0038D11A7E
MWVFIILLIILSVILGSITIALHQLLQKIDGKLSKKTPRKNLREHQRLITLINNITDAILSTDEHGIINTYNSAALNLIDTNSGINGEHISQVLELKTIDKKPIDIFKELTKSSTIRQRDDIIMMIDDDDYVRLEVTLAPVQGGDKITPDGYVLILRDVTKTKSLEEERDEFISIVSHELRTPIAIAEGSLSNAKLLVERNITSKIPEAIDESHKQILFLARMVNDLSTLSRAERGIADETEIIDVAELAAQINSEYSPQAAEKNLAFNLDIGGRLGSVQASRLYLEEILQNFITNAIRYTQEGSVTLSIKKNRSGEIIFKIIDTGIGISKADLNKIFDKFYRAEDYRTRETKGTGLGLYVSAKLAKKLGCKIEVESRLNHGSTFGFRLKEFKK